MLDPPTERLAKYPCEVPTLYSIGLHFVIGTNSMENEYLIMFQHLFHNILHK